MGVWSRAGRQFAVLAAVGLTAWAAHAAPVDGLIVKLRDAPAHERAARLGVAEQARHAEHQDKGKSDEEHGRPADDPGKAGEEHGWRWTSQGKGEFTMEFAKYSPCPAEVAEELGRGAAIAQAAAADVEHGGAVGQVVAEGADAREEDRVLDGRRGAHEAVPDLDREHAVALMDSARHRRVVTEEEFRRARETARGRRGAARSAAWWAESDPRAESPIETAARLACTDTGCAPDALQGISAGWGDQYHHSLEGQEAIQRWIGRQSVEGLTVDGISTTLRILTLVGAVPDAGVLLDLRDGGEHEPRQPG